MYKDSKTKIELLKKQVLINADLSSVNDADMLVLTNKVKQATNKELSLVTLRRLYELNEARFGPSRFTLLALANFCGYESWEKFCELT